MTDAAIKKALSVITSDSNFEALQHIANLLIIEWRSQSSIGSTEWETVKRTIAKEEKENALKIFLSELERIANE